MRNVRDRSGFGAATVAALLVLSIGSCREVERAVGPEDEALATSSAQSEASQCVLGLSGSDAVVEADRLGELVGELEAAGRLNAGQARALRNHLENAVQHVEAGRTCPARAQFDAFFRQAENFRNAGHLTDREVSPLLQAARLLKGGSPPPVPGEEQYAPGVVGELRTVTVGGETVTYEVIDGLAIYQGDMILGYADEVDAWLIAEASAAAEGGDLGTQAGVCRVTRCEVWTDGIIGYDFADNWGADNPEMRRRIEQAIAHWMNTTGIRFVRRASGERAVFRNSTGCSSHVGRKVFTGLEPQWINLSTGCGVGTIVHEIAHAFGIWHEQSRWDRDNHIRVHEDRIRAGMEHNFDKYLWLGTDVGPYDHRSIMHYPCGAFRRDGAGNTIEPISSDYTCDDLGQRDRLADGDILGIYTRHPPVMTITGATNGETRDRFVLGLEFVDLPVQAQYLEWRSDQVDRLLATGRTLETVLADLPPGPHRITARVVILGTTAAETSIDIVIHNDPPAVDLGPDLTVPAGQIVTLTANVTDPEDGICPVGVCTYAWDPTPLQDMDGSAQYQFFGEATRTVSVTVTDGAGATGTAEVSITTFAVTPDAVITSPKPGMTFSAGSTIILDGYALTSPTTPGPGPHLVECTRMDWESGDPDDVRILNTTHRCGLVLRLVNPGPRTITLRAFGISGTDGVATVDIDVVECVEDCAPDVTYAISTRPELNGELYTPPFEGEGYFLSTPIRMLAKVNDLDVPPDNPVSYEWRFAPPCFSPTGTCPPDVVVESGTIVIPESPVPVVDLELIWTPADDLTAWDNCITVALPITLTLEVTDGRGATRTFARTMHLACALT